jgi:hypothetical protein
VDNSKVNLSSLEYFESEEEGSNAGLLMPGSQGKMKSVAQTPNFRFAAGVTGSSDQPLQNKSLYFDSVKELHELLKEDSIIRNSFTTNRKQLHHFRLHQLICSEDYNEKSLGIEFSLLIYRSDASTRLSEITKDPKAYEILQKQESRDVW